MKVAIGSDHAGFDTKRQILDILKSRNIDAVDAGTFNNDSVDYPDAAIEVAGSVSDKKTDRGILICGSGVGMSIVANKFPSIRAALVTDIETARLSRLHNDANILILGGRMLKPGTLQEIINVWFSTEFEGGRHQRRLDKIAALEKKLYQR
jgi:ribose 5-phosphate isomerase B